MGLMDDFKLFLADSIASMQDSINMTLLDIKHDIILRIGSWSLGVGSVMCDLICVGIVVYACLVAFKIMTNGVFSEDKPSKLIDQSFYLSIGYFIARIFSNVLPLLK